MSAKDQGLQWRMQSTATADFGPTDAVATMRCPTCSGAGAIFVGKGVRGPRSERTHCARGHALTADNVYVRPRQTWRECRQCKRDYRIAKRAGGDDRG